jgi:hypothetical protein
MVPTLIQTECESDTTAVLVMYSVQKHGRHLYELQVYKTSGTDNKQCFNDLKDLLLHLYIMHRI